jgi:hypothetical protein
MPNPELESALRERVKRVAQRYGHDLGLHAANEVIGEVREHDAAFSKPTLDAFAAQITQSEAAMREAFLKVALDGHDPADFILVQQQVYVHGEQRTWLERADTQRRFENLVAERDALLAAGSKLSKSHDELLTALAQERALGSELRAKIEQLEDRIDDLAGSHDAAICDRDVALRQLKEAQDNVLLYRTSCENLDRERASWERKAGTLSDELAALRKQLAALAKP